MDNLELKISPFQERVLSIPEQYDLALGGGRGGSKSVTLALIALRHSEQYQQRARTLYLRQTYKGLEDFASITQEMFGMIYGKAARFNQAEHVWKFPNRAYLELGQLENPSDYRKYQGRSFTLLLIDELGQYAVPDLPDKVRSNLRGSDVPIRQCVAMNPGDPGHFWIAKRYVFNRKPWAPFLEKDSNKKCVYAPSTFLDNPFIDQAEYRRQLEASCPTDPVLLKAWLEGDWTVARGAFFASVIDEKRNMTDPWPGPPELSLYDPADPWELYLAHDYGSSAPSVTYVVAKSPGGLGPDKEFYPRDSLILVDELATNQPGHLTKGLQWTIPILSEAIIELSQRWKMKRAEGCADDSIFAQHGSGAGSIADQFSHEGVFFQPARKAGRVAGWEIMRRLLQDAGKVDVPGLYISRNCEYFWATVPFLGRDSKRADDVDSRGPDHGADACRYGCLFQRYELEVVSLEGV